MLSRILGSYSCRVIVPKSKSLVPTLFRRNISHARVYRSKGEKEETSYISQYTEKLNLENFDYLQDTFFQRLRADRREQVIFWGCLVFCFGTSIIVFSDGIISFFSKKSAKLASETLQDEKLKHSTDIMIREILENEENQAQVAQLLVNAIRTEGVYQAVLDLLLRLGDDQKFIAQLSHVLGTAVQEVINDPERYQQLINLIVKLVNDPTTSSEIIKILKEIAADPDMQVATGNHINVALKCALLWGYAKSLEKETEDKKMKSDYFIVDDSSK